MEGCHQTLLLRWSMAEPGLRICLRRIFYHNTSIWHQPAKAGCVQETARPSCFPPHLDLVGYSMPKILLCDYGRHKTTISISVSSLPTCKPRERHTTESLGNNTIRIKSPPEDVLVLTAQLVCQVHQLRNGAQGCSAWPEREENHVPAVKHDVCLMLHTRQQKNAWKQAPPNTPTQASARHKQQHKFHPKCIRHTQVKIPLASSPISPSVCKDLLMHQPYSNYHDHTAVRSKIDFITEFLDRRIKDHRDGVVREEWEFHFTSAASQNK